MDVKRWFSINIVRPVKFFYQRRRYGFDSSELWNLDVTFSKFILPRLKSFRKNGGSHPAEMSEKEWDEILGKMIYSFEWCANEERWADFDIRPGIQEGLDLFAKYFLALWD